MKYYGKSEEVCEGILKAFESNQIPEALNQVFVHRSDDVPSRKWSWSNQLIMAFSGTSDARGFKQWQAAGRKVKKGTHAIHILGPCLIKKQEPDENGKIVEISICVGFRSIPVHKIEDTEVFDQKLWEQACKADAAEENRLASLPYVEVAKSWGLSITSYNANDRGALGYYKHGQAIALGVVNLSTWAHELVHAADHKNGKLNVSSGGQKRDNEVVAELGGATLLKMAGLEYDADLGGCWQYILIYNNNDREKCLSFCFKMITRICEAINLILETAESVSQPAVATA